MEPDDRGQARVARTGIALVHEGELILPAEGSEAGLDREVREVRYVFPVEIEIRGGQEPADADAIADLTLRRLAEGLRAT